MRPYLLFDEVKIRSNTEMFFSGEVAVIWQVHPGATKKYYVFQECRNVGEWLSEDQFTF